MLTNNPIPRNIFCFELMLHALKPVELPDSSKAVTEMRDGGRSGTCRGVDTRLGVLHGRVEFSGRNAFLTATAGKTHAGEAQILCNASYRI